jgi:hypothetical protein
MKVPVLQVETPSRKIPTAAAQRALAPRPVGWRTTDADEIALRRQRAGAEPMAVRNLHSAEPIFSTFAVQSPSGSRYTVEVRSLVDLENSCSCARRRLPTRCLRRTSKTW